MEENKIENGEITENTPAMEIKEHSVTECNKQLNEAIMYLLYKERFYGNLIMNMRRKIDRKTTQTAGVNITDQINLYVNPDFFCSLNLAGQVDLLKHECEHIMNFHIGRGKDLNVTEKEFKTWNVACDLAINEGKDGLKEIGGMFWDKLNEMFRNEEKEYKAEQAKDNTLKDRYFPTLKQGDTSENYYKELRKYVKDAPEGGGQGMDSVDDHELWKEGQQNQEINKEMVKSTIKKAAAQSGGIGNCPGEVQIALDKLSQHSVNWKRQLRQFFTRSLQYDYEGTRKKRNRRTGLLNPGKKKKPNLNIAIAIDTSASVSNDELAQFFTEIEEIHNSGVKITVLEADTQVANVYEYNPKKKIEVKGRGGTAYQPVFDYVNENLKVDALIYFGDMDAWDTPTEPKYPVLWAIVGKQNPPADFGKEIRVEVKK